MPVQCMQFVGFNGMLSRHELEAVYKGSLDDVGTLIVLRPKLMMRLVK